MHICIYFAKANFGIKSTISLFIVLPVIIGTAAQVKSRFRRSLFGIIMFLVYISWALSALLEWPNGRSEESYAVGLILIKSLYCIWHCKLITEMKEIFVWDKYFSIQCASCQMAPLVNLVFVVWMPFVGDREWGPLSPVGLTSWLTAKRLLSEERTTSSSSLSEKRWLPRNAIRPVETKTWLSWSKFLDLCRFLFSNSYILSLFLQSFSEKWFEEHVHRRSCSLSMRTFV